MTIKKQKAEERLKDVYTEKGYDKLKKESKKNSQEIAEVMTHVSAINKKPTSLQNFEKQVDKDLRTVGIVDNAIKAEIMTKIQKTNLFRLAVENAVPDEEIIEVYKEALEAEKSIVVDKQLETTPDHNIRLRAADKLMEYKGVDTKKEADTTAQNNFSINLINPIDFQ